MRRLKLIIANIVWFLASAPHLLSFFWKTGRVRNTQAKILQRILGQNKKSFWGKRYDFTSCNTISIFQHQVPLVNYDNIHVEIERIAKGEKNILTEATIQRFALSSGSTTATKRVPYTSNLLAEFQSGIGAWVAKLFLNYPRLLLGSSYWSVTPVGREKRLGIIPEGFNDEGAYLDRLSQFVIEETLAVPFEVAKITNVEEFRYATLRYLIADKYLSFVSIWNPSFFTLLIDALPKHINMLIQDIERGELSLGVKQLSDKALHRISKNPKRAAFIKDS